jgi:hypothetical protein
MTEVLHCYENAMAERVNGILKQEYEMDGRFRTKEHARKAFEQAVFLYNTQCPHMGIGYQIPAEFHDKGQKRDEAPRLRLAPPSALRAAPLGTGFAQRSRTYGGTAKGDAYVIYNQSADEKTNHIFKHNNSNLKCQIEIRT